MGDPITNYIKRLKVTFKKSNIIIPLFNIISQYKGEIKMENKNFESNYDYAVVILSKSSKEVTEISREIKKLEEKYDIKIEIGYVDE